MAVAKRKLSVSLDEDLVAALADEGTAISVQVNEAVRSAVEHRRQQRALDRFCQRVVEETGPWTEEDEREIARIMRLLGG